MGVWVRGEEIVVVLLPSSERFETRCGNVFFFSERPAPEWYPVVEEAVAAEARATAG